MASSKTVYRYYKTRLNNTHVMANVGRKTDSAHELSRGHVTVDLIDEKNKNRRLKITRGTNPYSILV